MIVLNGLFQSTTAITAAVGIDGDSPAGDEPSVDPIIGDPDEQPKGDSTSDVVGQVALFSAAAISATALSVNSGVSGGFAAGSTDQKKEFDEAKKEARKVAAIASF